jgi:xylulose-5-phosphate/fructose-6-phosphate phosphoketolase
MFFVCGPGHGAPAILSNLYVSGELGEYYNKYSMDYDGLSRLVKDFSREGGFPSHVNPLLPGSIHEGGELGYALAVSYGAVMNNPDLIVTCLVGDGEAETGPTATAWHSHKFIDPKESGAVLPILHLNGFKISTPTIFGCMSDKDLVRLYEGYGYQVRIVGSNDPKHVETLDLEMALAMEWSYTLIREIQRAARTGKPYFKPHWPLIILRNPKGLGAPREYHHQHIEGTNLSHQVPIKDPINDEEVFKKLEQWLKSYNIEELIDLDKGTIKKELLDLAPKETRRMGANKHTNPEFKPLNRPDFRDFTAGDNGRGEKLFSSTEWCGKYLAGVMKNNPGRFKMFSPDELESNKLAEVLRTTHRCFQWHRDMCNRGGDVIEMLSEHTMQGFMQGFLLTGRFALFPSYEAFLGIIGTMMVQYAKFKKIALNISWRNALPSMNYIESSTLWRQEHNGFSHQNPGFINTLVNMKSDMVRVYLPPDANCLVCTMDHCLRSKNLINLIISSKNDTCSWLTMEEAIDHCRVGVSIWKWAGSDDDNNPDVVLCASGNEVTTEVVAAAQILKKIMPQLKIRVVNVTDLMIFETEGKHPHGLSEVLFNAYFTPDKPVIYNFHGYPSVVKHLIFDRPTTSRFKILGYIEEGTTTTPFNMLVSNLASRFHIAIDAINSVITTKSDVAVEAGHVIAALKHQLRLHKEYIEENNADPKELGEIMNPKQLE